MNLIRVEDVLSEINSIIEDGFGDYESKFDLTMDELKRIRSLSYELNMAVTDVISERIINNEED